MFQVSQIQETHQTYKCLYLIWCFSRQWGFVWFSRSKRACDRKSASSFPLCKRACDRKSASSFPLSKRACDRNSSSTGGSNSNPEVRRRLMFSPKNAWIEFANHYKFLADFNFWNFLAGLVLGCIKTKFRKKICVWHHFARSTRCEHFCTAAISKF